VGTGSKEENTVIVCRSRGSTRKVRIEPALRTVTPRCKVATTPTAEREEGNTTQQPSNLTKVSVRGGKSQEKGKDFSQERKIQHGAPELHGER
jgi:hypothetical protein